MTLIIITSNNFNRFIEVKRCALQLQWIVHNKQIARRQLYGVRGLDIAYGEEVLFRQFCHYYRAKPHARTLANDIQQL